MYLAHTGKGLSSRAKLRSLVRAFTCSGVLMCIRSPVHLFAFLFFQILQILVEGLACHFGQIHVSPVHFGLVSCLLERFELIFKEVETASEYRAFTRSGVHLFRRSRVRPFGCATVHLFRRTSVHPFTRSHLHLLVLFVSLSFLERCRFLGSRFFVILFQFGGSIRNARRF